VISAHIFNRFDYLENLLCNFSLQFFRSPTNCSIQYYLLLLPIINYSIPDLLIIISFGPIDQDFDLYCPQEHLEWNPLGPTSQDFDHYCHQEHLEWNLLGPTSQELDHNCHLGKVKRNYRHSLFSIQLLNFTFYNLLIVLHHRAYFILLLTYVINVTLAYWMNRRNWTRRRFFCFEF